MKKQIVILSSLILLLYVTPVTAEDLFFGDVSLGVRSVDVSGGDAKFNEYNDIKDGVFGDILLGYDSDKYSMTLRGDNIGLDTQYFKLTGRKWGLIKYSLFYNETPHNYTFNARTFYANPGSDNLSYSAATVPSDAQFWSYFDYAIKRKDLGANIEISPNSPFYLILNANQLQRDGIYPIGAPSGVFRTVSPETSPFGNLTELPAPVDDVTKNAGLEIGYKTKQLFVSLKGLLSNYEK